MIDPGLANKVVAVTGANNPSGIGAAIARAFAHQGANIFLHYCPVSFKGIRPEDAEGQTPGEIFYHAQSAKGIDEVLASLEKSGIRSSSWKADLSEPGLIPLLFTEAERSLGPVDILINNAAAWMADTFLPENQDLPNKTVEEWTDRPGQISAVSFEKNFAVNTRAVALLMAAYANHHIAAKKSWGRIINISTDGAYCFPSEVSYGAGKLALEGYSRSAAVELGQFGITVNVISPGPVQTGWITAAIEKEAVSRTPLGRIGRPKDIADVAVFLASRQAGWVTGQVIHAGGGHHL